MKFIHSYDTFINEAIAYNVAKPYIQLWKDTGGESRYEEWFNGVHRLYMDLLTDESPIFKDVHKVLQDNGYQVVDYYNNVARKDGVSDNREFGIGKLLYRFDKELKKEYDSHKDKTVSDEYMVVISRHAYDLLGISTDRKWHSCMSLDDSMYQSDSIKDDIKQGSLVAYLIERSDTNIKNPINRLLIKPFTDESNHTVLATDAKVYFNKQKDKEIVGFRDTVDKWLEGKQVIKKDVLYKLNQALYPDGKDFVLNSDFMPDLKRRYKNIRVLDNGMLMVSSGSDKKELKGIVNKNGKLIIPVIYNSIEYRKDKFIVMSGTSEDKTLKHGLVDNIGEFLIPLDTHTVYYEGNVDTYLIVKDKQERLYNTKTKVYSEVYDSVDMRKRYAIVSRDNKNGIISIDNFEEIIPLKYYYIEFSSFLSAYIVHNKSFKKGLCNLDGKEIIPTKYDEIDYEDGMLILTDGDDIQQLNFNLITGM
jgi:hypothetical protein